MVIFVWGAGIYFHERRPPANALEVYGVGKQWMWKFEYTGGQREINSLHVPTGRPVKISMISQDVIHSLFFPAFRVKQDVLPNRYTDLWFEATQPGTYHLFCSQYCGTKHSGMIGEVVVMKPEDFEAWLGSGKAEGCMAANGEKLFQELGCITCHRPDSGARGPNLQGLYGRPVRLADGRTVVADDNYIRESILNPNAKIVSGFQPIMPTFQGVVSEEGLIQITEYLKNLSEQESQPLNNRTSPTQLRDTEVPTIQQELEHGNKPARQPGKKP